MATSSNGTSSSSTKSSLHLIDQLENPHIPASTVGTPFNPANFSHSLQGAHQSIASLANTAFEPAQGALQQVSSNLSHNVSRHFSETTQNLVRAQQSIEALVTRIQYTSEHFAERPSSLEDDNEDHTNN